MSDQVVTNLKIHGSKVVSRTYKGSYKRSEVVKLVKQFQDKYIHKSIQLMVSVNTPFGFRSAKSFDIHDDPIILDDYEWNTTNGFIIYCWKKSAPTMGENDLNSCLFDAIQALLTTFRLPKDIKTDECLKTKLGICPTDKIPMNKIPQVEKLMSINININGDYTYTSKHKYNRTINLMIQNEHVTMIDNNGSSKSLINQVPSKQQNLILVHNKDNGVICYDGENKYELSREQYDNIDFEFFGPDVYIDKTPFESTGDIVEDYNYFMSEIQNLKELSQGRIDLTKSGYKVTNEALKCVHFSLLAYDEPQEISLQEQEWISNCFKGGLIFSKANTVIEHAYCYDKNSAYPNMMCNDHFTFPTKQGIFLQIQKFDSVIKYGIYRCVISCCEDENLNKLFKFNKLNYYTHFDINLALKLGLNVNLIIDNESNALQYETGRGNGAQYFRQIVHSLYSYKSKSKLAKRILNAIWGALSQRKKVKRSTYKEINLTNNENIIDIYKQGNHWKVIYLKRDKYFKYSYARLGCFLTSAVRKEMSQTMLPYKDNVFRCHTDSILSDKPLPLLIGQGLGEFKLEFEGKVHIENSNSVIYN